MDNLHKKYTQLRLLICECEEGVITPENMERLNQILLQDSGARQYYLTYIHAGVILKTLYTHENRSFRPAQESDHDLDYMHLFNQLAEDERTAPSVELPKEQPELIQKVIYEKPARKINKCSLASGIIAVAAMLFLAIFIKLNPVPTQQQIAILTNSTDAKWFDSQSRYKMGEPIYTNDLLELAGGSIELTVDNGVKLFVEGPIRFTFADDMQVFLDEGKLVANVPINAAGFSVKTPSATVVDLGTEFGTLVDTEGSTEVGVLKGKVSLLAGRSGSTSSSQILTANEVRRVDFRTSRVETINKYESAFVNRMLTSYEQAIQDTNPAAYWKLGQAENRIIGNIFGRRHYSGRLGEGTSKTSFDIKTNDDVPDQAIHFPGTQNNYIDFDSILDPLDSSYTVSIWFEVDATNTRESKGQFLVSKHSEKQYGWRVIVHEDNLQARVTAHSDDGQVLHVNKNRRHCVTAGRYHHLVMVIDRNQQVLKLYFDGTSEGWAFTKDSEEGLFNTNYANAPLSQSFGTDTVVSSNGSLVIGQRDDSTGSFGFSPFKGDVYDLGIWDRALSEEEIQSIYTRCPLTESQMP